MLAFVNLSDQTNLDVWRRVFPESLSFDLLDAKPPRVKVYYNKVLTELTSQSKRGSAGRGT